METKAAEAKWEHADWNDRIHKALELNGILVNRLRARLVPASLDRSDAVGKELKSGEPTSEIIHNLMVIEDRICDLNDELRVVIDNIRL